MFDLDLWGGGGGGREWRGIVVFGEGGDRGERGSYFKPVVRVEGGEGYMFREEPQQ